MPVVIDEDSAKHDFTVVLINVRETENVFDLFP